MTPSAVSHSIAKLEEELGAPLFAREGRRILLTPTGRRFVVCAEDVVQSLARLRADMRSDSVTWATTYRIAGTHGLASRVVAPAWTEVAREHGALCAELLSMRTADIVRAVAAGELDLAVAYSPLSHPDIEAETLVSGLLLVVVRGGHPLMALPRTKRPTSLASFSHAAVKALVGVATCEDHPSLRAWGVTADRRFTFDNYDVACEYVRRSDAWVLLPEWTFALAGVELSAAAIWASIRRRASPRHGRAGVSCPSQCSGSKRR